MVVLLSVGVGIRAGFWTEWPSVLLLVLELVPWACFITWREWRRYLQMVSTFHVNFLQVPICTNCTICCRSIIVFFFFFFQIESDKNVKANCVSTYLNPFKI